MIQEFHKSVSSGPASQAFIYLFIESQSKDAGLAIPSSN